MQAVPPLEADLYWVLLRADPALFCARTTAAFGLFCISRTEKSKPLPCALGEGEADIPEICLPQQTAQGMHVIVEKTMNPSGWIAGCAAKRGISSKYWRNKESESRGGGPGCFWRKTEFKTG